MAYHYCAWPVTSAYDINICIWIKERVDKQKYMTNRISKGHFNPSVPTKGENKCVFNYRTWFLLKHEQAFG
jgi:hypothetical protein